MPILLIDYVPYEVMVEDLETRVNGHEGLISFTAKHQYKVINKCDCCGRFDMEPLVLFSVEDLIEHGWIVPVKKEE